MSPDRLINKLEALGSIDPKIIRKLREQVKSSAKPVKATSILKYLVKKELLSQSDAKAVLKAAAADTDGSDQLTRLAEPEELLIDEPDDDIEVARVEESLSAVIDPIPDELLGLDKAPVGKKPVNTDYFHDTAGSTGSSAGENGDEEPTSALGQFRKNDQKNQWASKWPYIGGVSLVLLAGIVFFLSIWFVGASAEEQYDAAVTSLKNSTFEDAIVKFDEFIKDNPSHKNIDLAKTYRVQSVMRSKFASKNWSETIMSGQELLPPLAEEPENKLTKVRDDLGYMLTKSLFHESERAVNLKELPEMEKAKRVLDGFWEFIDNPLYLSGVTRKGETVSKFIANIENNRSAVSGLIDKEKSYSSTITKIKSLGQEKQTDQAFRTYIELTREYPDLAARKELRSTMRVISDAEQVLVTPVEANVEVSADDSTAGAGRSIVLASTSGKPVNGLRGESLSALVDGAAYGFDAANGNVLWRKFVGLQTTFQPKPFDEETVIVSDMLRFRVSRIRTDDGTVDWSAEIGERFHEPNFNEERVVVTTLSGKILLLDGESGEMIGGSQLPQATNAGALVGSRSPVIYQTGSYSNLYAISTSTFDCQDVMYLGHARNSISVPPISWSGYLVIVKNGGDFADLLVIKPDESGLDLKMAQVINRVTDAPISTPIRNFGRGLFLFADNGDMRVLELNPGSETNPVSVRIKKRFETSGQNAYATFQGTKLWAAGRGLRRYRVQRNLGQLKDEEVVEPGDTFLSPPVLLDDKLFHVRRRLGSSMVSASLVDAKSLEPVWRTDFGGEIAGVIPGRDGVDVVSNQGDIFRVGRANLESGVASSPVIASEVIENLSFDNLLKSEAGGLIAVSGNKNNDLLSLESGSDKSRLFKLGLEPGDAVSHPPILIDGKLVVASKRGQIAKIDAESGLVEGTPFLPPVAPGMTVPWMPLVDVGNNQVIAAHSQIIADTGPTPSILYMLSLEGRAVKKTAELALETPIVSQMQYRDGTVFGVTSDGTADNLVTWSVEGQPTADAKQQLDDRYVAGPWLVGDLLLLQTDQDELVSYDLTLQRKWAVKLGNVRLAGPPVLLGQNILLTINNGMLIALSPEDGSQARSGNLQQPLAKQPVMSGGNLWIPGSDGTVHLIEAASLK